MEHPIACDELRAIKRYELPGGVHLRTRAAAHTSVLNYVVAEAAARAGFTAGAPAHAAPLPRILAANRGYDLRLTQDYLGHRDPTHTVHFTRLAARRFEGLFWR